MVERFFYTEDVVGSIPTGTTKFIMSAYKVVERFSH